MARIQLKDLHMEVARRALELEKAWAVARAELENTLMYFAESWSPTDGFEKAAELLLQTVAEFHADLRKAAQEVVAQPDRFTKICKVEQLPIDVRQRSPKEDVNTVTPPRRSALHRTRPHIRRRRAASVPPGPTGASAPRAAQEMIGSETTPTWRHSRTDLRAHPTRQRVRSAPAAIGRSAAAGASASRSLQGRRRGDRGCSSVPSARRRITTEAGGLF